MKTDLTPADSGVAQGKRPLLLLLRQVEYYENLAVVSIRRLWFVRSDAFARQSIRGWIGTLRDARKVRAYRGWVAS